LVVLFAVLTAVLPLGHQPGAGATKVVPSPVVLSGGADLIIQDSPRPSTGSLAGTIDFRGNLTLPTVAVDQFRFYFDEGTLPPEAGNPEFRADITNASATGSFDPQTGALELTVKGTPRINTVGASPTSDCVGTNGVNTLPIDIEFEQQPDRYPGSVAVGGSYALKARVGTNWSGSALFGQLCPALPIFFDVWLYLSFDTVPVIAPPAVSVGDVRVYEGDAKSRNAVFPVSLSRPSDQTVTVDVAVSGTTATPGTPKTPGADFKGPITRTLTFRPGQVMRYLNVAVFGDTVVEPDEQFEVTLSNPTGGAALGKDIGLGTISDDDDPAIFSDNNLVAVSDVWVVEGDAGKRTAKFTVSLSEPANGPVTIEYYIWANIPGQATGGYASGPVPPGTDVRDYLGATRTLTFKPGASGFTGVQKTVSVTLYPDTAAEPTEGYGVVLSNSTGPVNRDLGGDPVGFGFILDDD
jgi:hypothetical protein